MVSPASNVVLIQLVRAPRLGEIEDKLNIIIVKHLAELPLVLLGEEDLLAPDVRILVQELLDLLARTEQLEAEISQALGDGAHFRLGDVATDEDTRAGTRLAEASCAEERSPESVVDILAEACDLTG